MRPSVSIIIPAWNEERLLPVTLNALKPGRQEGKWGEIVVVDDGSSDNTNQAAAAADKVIRQARNLGKGKSLESGWRSASGEIVIFLDADLGESAALADQLLAPLLNGQYDMSIARFPAPRNKGGLGIVKGLASRGIYALSGYRPFEPLSGQRAIRRELLERIGGLAEGFGIEVGLTIDAHRSGYRICEVPVTFRHRESGRDLQGFVHRGKQFISVARTLFHKWRHPVC